LEKMLRAIRPEILLKSKKGLENLDRVKKASKETVYGVEKGYRHTGHCYALCLSYSS
jgi:hypothetical protein